MNVVIDTNCLLVAVPANSEHKWLYDAFVNERFTWYVSTEILNEYAEKLGEFFGLSTAEYVLNSFDNAPNVLFAEPYFRWQLIKDDPDDNKFADLAICMNVDYLVSNDRHLRAAEPPSFPSVTVVTLQQFKSLIER